MISGKFDGNAAKSRLSPIEKSIKMERKAFLKVSQFIEAVNLSAYYVGSATCCYQEHERQY